MNIGKKISFINKLAEDTANNKYEWHLFEPSHRPQFKTALSPVEIAQLSFFNCFWFENNKQFIFLLATSNMEYSILLIDKNSDNATRISIPTESYFRLKTLIFNSLGTQDQLLNDFLDS